MRLSSVSLIFNVFHLDFKEAIYIKGISIGCDPHQPATLVHWVVGWKEGDCLKEEGRKTRKNGWRESEEERKGIQAI